ncbi:unnamed protein product [Lymnaea stagnalis]|uniref:PH domain-containing protein n=1 Tax=Lymnaea stagnalis TaxID=6523 RepID=A0AAV2H2Z0_LYMST
MKRRKPTKMTNVVHSGWMTKSPPERRLNSAFKIFRAQWKKRFFVLRKPSGSLPDQYELDYYKDEYCSSKKGSIDLEQCEQIIEALDSELFPNLLAIKTYCKSKVRTYYLAADTEQEMNNWVQWLCHVCGLRPEDQPTDIPEQKPVVQQPPPPQPTLVTNGQPASPPIPVVKPPTQVTTPTPATNQHLLTRTSSDSSSSSYIPLERCTTGPPQPPADRRESVESVPDFVAPAPPPLQREYPAGTSAPEDEVFLQDSYHPPPQHVDDSKLSMVSDLYQVPPVYPQKGQKAHNLSYDVPPPQYDHSPRSSLSARTDSATSGSGDGRAVTPSECYDYPPPRLDSTTSSDGDVPPERPPKPAYRQSPYQNLPPAGKISNDTDLMSTVPAPPKLHGNRLNSGYDVPRSTSHRPSRTSQSTSVTPIPARPQRGTVGHTYFNTRPGSAEMQHGQKGSGDPERLEQKGAPAVPPPRHGSAGELLDGTSIYQHPPPSSSSPALSGAPNRPPARHAQQAPTVMPRTHEVNNAQGQEDNANIFSTQRTRSFKRQNQVNQGSPKLGQRSHGLPITSLVPAPRPVPPRPKEVQPPDEEESLRSRMAHMDTEEETHHPLSLLHSVPAPSADLDLADRELKYIDLALPDSAQDTPRPAHSHGYNHSHSHSHMDRSKELATEYREIDFIKTQALSDAKKVKEKEREEK